MYGLFWAKPDLGGRKEALHVGGKGNLFSPCFSCLFFVFPGGFSQTRPNSQKNDGGWMGG